MAWLLIAASAPAGIPDNSVEANGVGRIHFPITASPAAQAQFDRAVAMLHSFWYEELGREFGKVIELDPNCAMAYWGLAMGLWHPLWDPPDTNELKEGFAAVDKATQIGTKTLREQAYIAAISSFYKDYQTVDHDTRAQRYLRAMEKIHDLYPEDHEATAFYALALLGTASLSDRSYTNQVRAAALLEKVAAAQTNHPGVVHYRIHAYDTPTLAARGLPEAWCYAQIAPAIPHAQHMPSHIFTRLGLWKDSIRANLASEAAAKSYAAQTKMVGTWDEQLHAMDYLAYAYLQTAQDKAAARLVGEVRNMRRAAQGNFKSGYALAAIPARYVLERRQWTEAAALELAPKDFPWANHAWPLALNRFARCLGAARAGKLDEAREQLALLSQLRSPETTGPAGYGLRQVDILYAEARGYTAYAGREEAEALRWLKQAVTEENAIEKRPVTPGPLIPARELYAELLLDLKRFDEALAEFDLLLKEAPKRFNALYGAGQAALGLGEKARALEYFETLAMNCQHADADRPELLTARKILQQR